MDIQTDILPSMVLAPSAHNTQPWQFAVHDNTIDIYTDETRHLPVSDPARRQLYISLGCAITNGLIAAAHHGYTALLTHFPTGKDNTKPVARITVTAGGADQHLAELYPAIERRRTDRTIYDGQPLTNTDKSALPTSNNPSVLFTEEQNMIKQLAKLTGEGSYQTLARADFKEELSHWVRNNWTKQPDGMPGYAMGIPAPLTLVAPIMVRIAPIHKQEQTNTAKQINSASAIAVITTDADTPTDWLTTGQLLEQLWLEAVTVGLSAAPLAAAVEAGEKIRRQTQQVLQTKHLPQMILRLGHSQAKNLRATPRRSVKDCLLARSHVA